MTPLYCKDENSFRFSLFVDVRFKLCSVLLIWIKHSLLFRNTVEPPLTTTSKQRPSTATPLQWFFFSWRIRSIHWILFQPLYNGHFSTTAIFFSWLIVHTLNLVSTSLQRPFFFLADSPYTKSCFNFFTTATSLQWPPLYNGHFSPCGQSIHWLLCQPLYNGHLSTMATSLQRPFFSRRTVHILTLVSTSLQRPPVYYLSLIHIWRCRRRG